MKRESIPMLSLLFAAKEPIKTETMAKVLTQMTAYGLEGLLSDLEVMHKLVKRQLKKERERICK